MALLFHRSASSKTINASQASRKGKQNERKWNVEHPRALIFPSQTTHKRKFPERHSFRYSYLLCGYPIVPSGITVDGTAVSDGNDSRLGSWWLQVRAEDYLSRGGGTIGFYRKLQEYLKSQGLAESEWSYAYLVTAPRFFGYAFNPVSFWYIYNQQHQLTNMILEVNNTFGERRIYLLDGSSPSSPTAMLPQARTGKSHFVDNWAKDFHVSPFNSRKGSYHLRAVNPFPSPKFANPLVDNVITLRSSKDHSKIMAQVKSTRTPYEPSALGLLGSFQLIGGWGWVGFVTFPRIIREAFKLYFHKCLHVWFRPEVLSTSIGRAPSYVERTLQPIFCEYLELLVRQCPDHISLTYHTTIPDKPPQIIESTQTSARPEHLDIRILSPAFYSRFVHYRHTPEAFDRECLFTDEKNRTLWISRPELLASLVAKPPVQDRKRFPVTTTMSDCLNSLRWVILRRLRCPPAASAYTITRQVQSGKAKMDDIRALPYSDLDDFVRTNKTEEYAGLYRRMLTKLFLAQRFALGFVEVVDAADFLLRLTAAWIGTSQLLGSAEDTDIFGLGQEHPLPLRRLWEVGSLAVSLCSCHLYGLAKGYS